MFQKTLVVLTGLATLLIAIALAIPHWHSVQWDKMGYAHSYSGLWKQVFSFKTQADEADEEAFCNNIGSKTYPSSAPSPSEVIEMKRECNHGHSACFFDDKTNTCGSWARKCRTHDKKSCPTPYKCKWNGGECVHESYSELDVVIPYTGEHAKKESLVEFTRVIGIVAAALAGVAMVVAGMDKARPMLVAMVAGVATLCATGVLIIYGADLSNTFESTKIEDFESRNGILKDIASFMIKLVNKDEDLVAHSNAMGGSFWMVLIATIFLAIASVLGIATRPQVNI